jgi:hypothetical protein
MRNLFDQYEQPENRLSHALAVCLHEDRRLLRGFVRWVGAARGSENGRLIVVEQSLPGDPLNTKEEEAERKGLPDIVIHDGESWCIPIESKIQAKLTEDQLQRHEATLRRRDFREIACVALTKSGVTPPRGVIGRSWSELYEWLGTEGSHREWPERLRAYLRVAEVRLAREEYLTEGTLTMFDGFPFSEDNPYTYGEGKRLIRLALDELCKLEALRRLGVDRDAAGRGKITGRDGRGVWDYLALKDRPRGSPFTRYPHLTLGVREDGLNIAVTIPNGVIGGVRSRLARLTPDEHSELISCILMRSRRLLRNGGRVEAFAVQRHYPSRSAPALEDAQVRFNLETSQGRGGRRVKAQLEWARLFAELLKKKQANIQFGYEIKLPWGMPGLNTRKAVAMIADGWCSLKPLLDVLRGRNQNGGGKSRRGRQGRQLVDQ